MPIFFLFIMRVTSSLSIYRWLMQKVKFHRFWRITRRIVLVNFVNSPNKPFTWLLVNFPADYVRPKNFQKNGLSQTSEKIIERVTDNGKCMIQWRPKKQCTSFFNRKFSKKSWNFRFKSQT